MNGWILIEEEVDRVLAEAEAEIAAAFGNGSIDTLLARAMLNVAPRKRAELRNLLKSTLPKIIHGWPHEQETFPCWAIIVKDGHNTQYVGDGLSYITQQGTIVQLTSSTVRWDNRIGIVSLSENGDTARYLNQLAKFFLDRAKDDLAAVFEGRIIEQNVGEEDLGPPQEYSGRVVWARQTILSVGYHQVDDHTPPTVTEVDGPTEAHDAFH